MPEPTKGYIIVANRAPFFFRSAINLIDSIREYDPINKITLVTEERWLDGSEKLADNVIICDDHKRAKLWGMAQSPYDLTFYIDADCEVQHEDLPTVFDKFDGNDMCFTYLPEERSYCYAELHFPGGKFEWCGGVCLYDMRKPLVKQFMNDWYDLTVEQYAGRWWPLDKNGNKDYATYPQSLSRWDQFSLWWLVNKDPRYCDTIKVGRLDGEEDARWNRFHRYRENHSKGEPVIWHFSSIAAKREM